MPRFEKFLYVIALVFVWSTIFGFYFATITTRTGSQDYSPSQSVRTNLTDCADRLIPSYQMIDYCDMYRNDTLRISDNDIKSIVAIKFILNPPPNEFLIGEDEPDYEKAKQEKSLLIYIYQEARTSKKDGAIDEKTETFKKIRGLINIIFKTYKTIQKRKRKPLNNTQKTIVNQRLKSLRLKVNTNIIDKALNISWNVINFTKKKEIVLLLKKFVSVLDDMIGVFRSKNWLTDGEFAPASFFDLSLNGTSFNSILAKEQQV